MMTDFFLTISVIILCFAFVCLYRALFGPTIIDRIIAVNVIGTKTVTVILFMGFIFHRVDMFIDISIVYALINFIGTLTFTKYFEQRGVL
jgi:multicomponent Na+:H+ antiporter subunit F